MDASTIAIVLAVITLLWKCIEFFVTHNNDAKNRQFEAYHRLIKELVQPSETGDTYADRQCAAVFELVRFKHYKPLTIRILTGLRDDWTAQRKLHPRLATELELALSSLRGVHLGSVAINPSLHVGADEAKRLPEAEGR